MTEAELKALSTCSPDSSKLLTSKPQVLGCGTSQTGPTATFAHWQIFKESPLTLPGGLPGYHSLKLDKDMLDESKGLTILLPSNPKGNWPPLLSRSKCFLSFAMGCGHNKELPKWESVMGNACTALNLKLIPTISGGIALGSKLSKENKSTMKRN